MDEISFSPKQRTVLTWWRDSSPHRTKQAIICDGAVRSGKTLSIGLSFFCWAMQSYQQKKFALCGKTIQSLKRNLLEELIPLLERMGFQCQEKTARNILVVTLGKVSNTFYLFGGKDESSAGLIQGITLAGVLLDEVALMPQSFVEQAVARCSVTGSRLWFSCNPESPSHWFYREWILKAEEKGALRIPFSMEDNPGLSPQVLERYKTMFEGNFYRRFVLGEWVAAEGLVYDFFDESYVKDIPDEKMEEWYISCDYGTVNPTSMGLWGKQNGIWYRIAEYYYDARAERHQKTDEEYVRDLEQLAGERQITAIVLDPSAASFSAALRRRGWKVLKANNQVLSGIRLTAQLLKSRRMVICKGCTDSVREFGLYRWEEAGDGQDRVRKENDHAMDEIRYFAATVVESGRKNRFFAGSIERETF